MKKCLNKLPKEIRDLLSLAGELASSNRMSAYLVGGFVRDLLLGVKNLDLDIVIEGDGIRFAQLLAAKLDAGLIVHSRFHTATLTTREHLKIDIATARRERYPAPAHLPEVTCGLLKDDLLRRDFTINAMAVSINHSDFGRLVDCFGGREDLIKKKIRVLHPLSFIDDPTRILRAVRFEQRYDFKIEPVTFGLLREARDLKMMEKVQPHRMRDELIMILKEDDPLKPLARLKGLVGLDFISKGLSLTKSTLALLRSSGIQIKWFRKKYPRRRKLDNWLIYFIALISPLSLKTARSICAKFALRKGEEKRIVTYKKVSAGFIRKLSDKTTRPSQIYKLLEPLSYEVIILLRAGSKDKRLRKNIDDFFGVYNGTRVHIRGEDLHRLGLAPGPRYQKIFHRVLEAKLDGKAGTKKEELVLIRKITLKKKLK